ncbi:hypothetical protein [Arthrobacter ruber]|uniref:hypothetical protein n=1 Tax=Arthrobacter ruber TaxID=1258893 RepID=UPI0012FFECC2|nr:hypothetical protein [Arthrobacter ruber]
MSADESSRVPRIGRNFVNLSGLTSAEAIKLLESQTSAVIRPLGSIHSPYMLDSHVQGVIGGLMTPLATRLQNQFSDILRPLRARMDAQLTSAFKPFRDAYLQQIRSTLQPLINHDFFGGIERGMLPPILRVVSHDIKPSQVYEFLETEGIPLYLVPRADIAVRLLKAQTHQARRKVLNDRQNAIVGDCVEALQRCRSSLITAEVDFVQDGIRALQGGSYSSAQALFTVTLDTLITKLLPERHARNPITKRKMGHPVPTVIEEMGLHQAFVWLPIWNSHGEFWASNGDKIPSDYSRHATVHAVSKTQYSKRNCIQALMLVTSLLGYSQQIIDQATDEQN